MKRVIISVAVGSVLLVAAASATLSPASADHEGYTGGEISECYSTNGCPDGDALGLSRLTYAIGDLADSVNDDWYWWWNW